MFNKRLSLTKMRKMDGKHVYVFANRSWARISMKGPYPLLIFEDGNCASWEDWPDIQTGGIYIRPPLLKRPFAQYAK